MSRDRKRRIRGHAEPVFRGRPLFLRSCEAFIDNLTLILKVALVAGALVFVQELHVLRELFVPVEEDAAPAKSAYQPPPTAPEAGASEKSWLTEGVRHALNCTHTDYRNAHYDECVKEPSKVYSRPEAGPDDIGFVLREDLVLYVSLQRAATPAFPDD
jgi:hypothetical protein